MKSTTKILRRFSSAFKKEKVKLLDQGKLSVKDLSEIYEVSQTAIYKWKRKYSKLEKAERIVIEKVSEETKNIELLKRVAELERIIGKKQMELDYYKTTIEVLSEEAGEDLIKKHKPKS